LIVVGAGIVGLSCAWRLAQRGLKVTVFDAREAASEASWAGAGMLAPGGECESDTPLARLLLRSLSLYPDYVTELRQESGCLIDFRRCGGFEIAFTEAESAALDRRAAAQQSLGIRSESARCRTWPARFYPDDAIVDPRDVTRALLTACRNRGVQIREHEPVERIPDNHENILIAAGAWSSALHPGLPRTMPVRGHLIAWHMPPGLLPHILRHGHTYLLQRTSGLLIAGSTTEHVGFDRTLDESAVADIHTRASELLPELANHPPDERWNGLRPGIDATEPAIGRIPGTSIWTAFGHYRNGILLAPETARLIAESVSS
jgi:glycine oxidase